MKLFNRNKGGENIPEEVKGYYQAERRERLWLAWLLAFTTLVVTVLIVIGLSFGGRWAYRKITHKDKKIDTTKTIGTNQPTSLPTGSTDKSTSGGQSSDQTQTPATTQNNQSSTSTPTTGPNASSTLVSTGPEGDD